MKSLDLSIILACYNEGPTFESSVDKILSVLKKTRYKWEIIFVEDKSTDDTAKTIEILVKKIKTSRVIFHKKNIGRGKTVSDGIIASRAKICGYLDVDLEVSAKYIPLFVKKIEDGFDLVNGNRYYDNSSIPRFIASKSYALIVKHFLQLPVFDTECGYKFFRRKRILQVLLETRDKKWFWDTEICARAYYWGLKVGQVPVVFVKRPEKKSTVNLIPDTLEYLTRILEFKGQIKKLQRTK